MHESRETPKIPSPSAPPASPAPPALPARRAGAHALGCLILTTVLLVPAATLVPGTAAAHPGEAAATADDAPLVGVVSREQVEAAVPAWVQAEVHAEPDPEAARHLLAVEPGAEVTVYFGTWCSDSRRELSRLWRAFDEVGVGFGADLPFRIEYVAVDRDKKEPADRVAGVDLEYVPTFVVRRDGHEVGRMVEVSPHGIEADLLALLSGEAEGVVSARDDLGAAAPSQATAPSHATAPSQATAPSHGAPPSRAMADPEGGARG